MLYTYRPVTLQTNSCLRAECKFAEQWKRWRQPIASASGVSNELAVVREIRRGFAAQRLEDQNGQFEDDPLLYWQPVQTWQNWWDVVMSPGASQKSPKLTHAAVKASCTIYNFYYHNWLITDLTWVDTREHRSQSLHMSASCMNCHIFQLNSQFSRALRLFCIFDHPRSGMVYNFGCVCLSVHQKITFESFDLQIRYSPGNTGQVRLWRSSVKVKVTGANRVANPYSRNVKFDRHQLWMKHRAMEFACSMVFTGIADRLMWPPCLSRDRN